MQLRVILRGCLRMWRWAEHGRVILSQTAFLVLLESTFPHILRRKRVGQKGCQFLGLIQKPCVRVLVPVRFGLMLTAIQKSLGQMGALSFSVLMAGHPKRRCSSASRINSSRFP